MLDRLPQALPAQSVLGVGLLRRLNDCSTLFGIAVCSLEAVKRGPEVAVVGVELGGPLEPRTGFFYFVVAPEELRHSGDDVRVVVAAFQRINTAALALRAGSHPDVLGP